MRVVGYARTSGARGEDSLRDQERTIRSWAREHHHRVVAVLRDEGVSGANGVEDREGLPEALALLTDGKAAGLVVPRLDRLARTLTAQEAILAKVWERGGRAFTTESGEVPQDDVDDPMRTAMRQMAGVFAQLERGMIRARLQRGRRRKAEAGGFAAYGSPPYGWRSDGDKLVPVPHEQAGIALARRLRAKGASLPTIAHNLGTRGFLPRRSTRWHPTGIKRLLDRA